MEVGAYGQNLMLMGAEFDAYGRKVVLMGESSCYFVKVGVQGGSWCLWAE